MKHVSKLAIVGSRTFNDYEMLCEFVIKHFDLSVLHEIVSGGAKGTDTLASRFANEFNLKLTLFRPEWDRYGRGAGIIRNRDIVNYADFVLAFSINNSPGTRSVINYCQKVKKPILTIYPTTTSFL